VFVLRGRMENCIYKGIKINEQIESRRRRRPITDTIGL
jgi:hypothetical protein